MAREVVSWCDPHLAHDERVPGYPVIFTVDGGKPVRVDLCADDRAALVEPLLAMLAEYGAPPDAPPPPSRSPRVPRRPTASEAAAAAASSPRRRGQPPAEGRPFQCLWCPLDYSSTSALGAHLRTAHGLGPVATTYGEVCPLDGETFANLGGHASRSHGLNTASLFLAALDAGDPLGVVAQVRAQAAVSA